MPPATPLLQRSPNGPGGRPPRQSPPKNDWSRRKPVIVAALTGGAALVVLLVFMASYRSSVRSGAEPVQVLVANRQLDSGTSGEAIAEAKLFHTTEVRKDEAADGAFTDPGSLRGKHTTRTIYAGEELTSADFASGTEAVTGRLEGTQRALSIPVDDAHGNIGQIHDGSKVDVLGGFDAEQGAGGRAQPVLDVLARNVLVLSAPAKSSGGIGSGGGKNQVVLRLTDREAARVAFASDHGDIWLTVRPPTLAEDSNVKTVEGGNLLGLGAR